MTGSCSAGTTKVYGHLMEVQNNAGKRDQKSQDHHQRCRQQPDDRRHRGDSIQHFCQFSGDFGKEYPEEKLLSDLRRYLRGELSVQVQRDDPGNGERRRDRSFSGKI